MFESQPPSPKRQAKFLLKKLFLVWQQQQQLLLAWSCSNVLNQTWPGLFDLIKPTKIKTMITQTAYDKELNVMG